MFGNTSSAATCFETELDDDARRLSALLDVRQYLGPASPLHDVLTGILIDHDLVRGVDEDYLVPGPSSPLWDRLEEATNITTGKSDGMSSIRRNVFAVLARARTMRGLPLRWQGDEELWIGDHQIRPRSRDLHVLLRRWRGFLSHVICFEQRAQSQAC